MKLSETNCGYFCWKGGVWQKLTSTKVYVLIYGLIGFLHTAVGSYEGATISTIEKRFKIPSRTSGLIVASLDIGTLMGLILLAFIGKGHKPRWVAGGTFLTAIACILCYLPQIVYGPGSVTNYTVQESETSKCVLGPSSDEVCTEGEQALVSSAIFITAEILLGVGTCMYHTLGIAYLDDNCRKNKMPFLLASTMTIRMLGPTLGYAIASYALSIYIDPSVNPGITPKDPRWIGAWWFGWFPMGIGCLLLSFLMWPFPRHLPRAYKRKIDLGIGYEQTKTTFKDFRSMCVRLVTNKILMFNTISSTFYMFGMMGYWIFMPKYLETQFQQTASSASFITGSVGLICSGLGILSSGFVITYFKPNPKTLALWNVICESIDVLGHISYAFLGCPSENLQGHWQNSEWSLTENCNGFCSCPHSEKYSPLCSQDGNTLFYSPCHAGCLQGSFNKTLQIYENCSCMLDMSLIPGPCPLQCATKFKVFIAILCTMRFFSSTGRAGNTLLQFRSVSEGDKAVSIGFTEAVMSIFAFVPAPIFYGALLDNACLVWGNLCGEKGNCWLYDGQHLRYYMNFTASAFLLLATLADIVVWKYSSSLDIYDKEETPAQQLLNSRHEQSKEVEK